MSWSFRIATVAGIDVKVHATFALILGLGAVQWGAGHGAPGALFGVLLTVLFFLSVVLHELGHSLVGRRFGAQVRDIVLLPIGGVARMERLPSKPRHELLMAAAGPAVSAALALLLLLAVGVRVGERGLAELASGALRERMSTPSVDALLLWLFVGNASATLFNLLPAFPMDGGRILRAALAGRVGAVRATEVAARVGRVLAVVMGAYALATGAPGLALIAAFVFLSAGQERLAVRARSALAGLRAGEVYDRHALALPPGATLREAMDHLLTRPQTGFPVVLGDTLYGVLSRARLLHAARHQPPSTYVAGLMDRNVRRVDASAPLEEVQALLGSAEVVAVYAGDHFLGLLGHEDLARAALVRSLFAFWRGGGGGPGAFGRSSPGPASPWDAR